MHVSVTQWVFSSLAVVLPVLLLGVMHLRKSKSDFPFFYSFIAFYAITQVILNITATGSLRLYFYCYWTIAILGSLFTFAVLYEVFVQIMRPYSALTDLAKMMFRWVGGFLLAVSFLTAATSAGGTTTKICAAILFIQRCIQLLQCGTLLLFLVFEKRLGASWSDRGMCIAVGLGFSAVLELSGLYLMNIPALQNALTMVNNIASNGIVLYWLYGMYAYRTVTKTADSAPNRLVLQRWNEVLASHGFGGGPIIATGSFISGVEQAVERVLARKAIH